MFLSTKDKKTASEDAKHGRAADTAEQAMTKRSIVTIEIELPCGARVRLIGDVAAERLTAVFSALARR